MSSLADMLPCDDLFEFPPVLIDGHWCTVYLQKSSDSSILIRVKDRGTCSKYHAEQGVVYSKTVSTDRLNTTLSELKSFKFFNHRLKPHDHVDIIAQFLEIMA